MIYDAVKSECVRQGITIMECEKRAHLGNGTIGGWRTADPKLSTVQAVADALGVPITTLLRDRKNEQE